MKQWESRFHIGQVGISEVSLGDVLAAIDDRVRDRKPAYICVANVRTTVLSQKDAGFCAIQNSSFLTIPDGMPLVWFARLAGYGRVERVTGPDLMSTLLEMSGAKGYRHYFYGDNEETLKKMLGVVRMKYPQAAVAGVFSPPFRELSTDEIAQSAKTINELKPTFVWIALGAPKQERLIAEMMHYIDEAIIVGVGAAFRFMIGEYRHPHPMVQKMGLEGVYWRFAKNPLREAKWYLHHIPAFGLLMMRMLIKRIAGKL